MITPQELDTLEDAIRAYPKPQWRACITAISRDPWTRWFLRERLRLEAVIGCSYTWGSPTDAHRCMDYKGHVAEGQHTHRCACGAQRRVNGYIITQQFRISA